MKKILLIGGNGYIGSRVYEHLRSISLDVDNVDLCMFGKIYNETIVKDFNTMTVEELKEYTHIILLAGHSGVAISDYDRVGAFKNNVTNFLDLVNKLTKEQILIYASTCAVYGNNAQLVDETFEVAKPLTFYDFTKISRDRIAQLYADKKIIGLRFGSVAGFSKSFRKDNLINSITTSTMLENKIIISNGSSIRSVLSIQDICYALEKIIKTPFKKSQVYNLTSVNDTILNFGLQIKQWTGSELIINNSYKTLHSWNCSPKLFERDYGFEFNQNLRDIYDDIINNYSKIQINTNRNKIEYV
jgi:UDP-glucose 4-epimerase